MERLIYKYIQGKLTKSEKLELKEWLEESPENLSMFKNFTGHWNLTDFDVELMKHKVWQKIPHEETVSKTRTIPINWNWVRVAAIIVAMIGISFYIMNNQEVDDVQVTNVESPMIEKIAERGQKLTVRLPDGSMVKLNADSKITYQNDFTGGSREVWLSGEAFFEVERDVARPFKIYSGELEVEVLGTSFNVNAYPEQHNASVSVRTGKVSVTNTAKTVGTVLVNQEKLVLSGSDGSFRKETITDAQMSYGWIDNYLSFNDLNLKEAMALVSKWFDVEYVIMNKRNVNKLITAKFNNPSLKNVMENLSYSYGFNYEMNENGIVIK